MTMKGNERKKPPAPAFTFIDGFSSQEIRFDFPGWVYIYVNT